MLKNVLLIQIIQSAVFEWLGLVINVTPMPYGLYYNDSKVKVLNQFDLNLLILLHQMTFYMLDVHLIELEHIAFFL